jgi:DNA-binding beta-propeller fold protein YncE
VAGAARGDFMLAANNPSGTSNDSIMSFTVGGSPPWPSSTFASASAQPALDNPLGMALAPNHANVFIGTGDSTADSHIAQLNVTTGAATVFNTTAVGRSWALAFGSDGFLYVADFDNNKVVRFNSAGVGTDYITGLTSPTGLAFSADGKSLYVANQGNGSVTNAYIDRYDVTGPTPVGSRFASGLSSFTTLALTPDGQYLFAATGPASSTSSDQQLLSFNVSTGQQTLIEDTGPRADVQALVFQDANNLYAIEARLSSPGIYHLPLTNDVLSGPVMGTVYSASLVGAVFLPSSTPEPGSLVLCGLSSLGLMLYEWRRRKQCRGDTATETTSPRVSASDSTTPARAG